MRLGILILVATAGAGQAFGLVGLAYTLSDIIVFWLAYRMSTWVAVG